MKTIVKNSSLVLVAVAFFLGACSSDPDADKSVSKDANPSVCTPGQDQTCNDDPTISFSWGKCQPDGTCTCDPGAVLNLATGRCKTACGDGKCELPETCVSCATDCGPCCHTQVDCGSDLDVSGSDASKDTNPSVCIPGQDQTCNDDPIISFLMGKCQPDGTCTCDPGAVINPATGRCKTACGDGKCELPETCVSCATDCGPCCHTQVDCGPDQN